MAAAKKRSVWAQALRYSELAFILPVFVVAGYVLGYLLDRWLKTSPTFSVILLLAGFAAGFWELYRMIVSYERNGDNSGS